ncbi:LbetaH domain-containing protein [Portibacter lacus]|uniref:PglD N-terminal domain-containing protein n=1 Tax=Portibacter lacus TaxID=1099794 RepID=A0AA37SM70_9BACT|nr:hypothetical protein [Portibacter lacus]GLR15952.1 hypothetical protein GCM10007940_05670 [Portibacter lacus]
MNERPLYILGKGNFALSIILDIVKLNNHNGVVTIVSNINEDKNTSTGFPYTADGIKIRIITMNDFNPIPGAGYILGSIGKSRMKIYNHFLEEKGITADEYVTLIHPSAVISSSVKMGYGVHIGPLSVIAPYAVLGNFATINRNCSVGHHTEMKDFACINPGVNISGICEIGINSSVGTGANVLDQMVIGDYTVIGAGSLVTRSLGDRVVAYGAPAKVVRPNVE